MIIMIAELFMGFTSNKGKKIMRDISVFTLVSWCQRTGYKLYVYSKNFLKRYWFIGEMREGARKVIKDDEQRETNV